MEYGCGQAKKYVLRENPKRDGTLKPGHLRAFAFFLFESHSQLK